LAQLQQVSEMVEREENPIIVEKLMQDRFTKQAIDRYTLRLTKMASLLENKNRVLMSEVLNKVSSGTKRRFMHLYRIQQRFEKIKNGLKVKKYNFGSNGFHVKFVKVVDGNKLVWCDKETDANNPKKRKEKDLAAIQGVFYGPVTDTWVTSKWNKNKDAAKVAKGAPWSCMSIMFEERSLDLYFEDVEEKDPSTKVSTYHTSRELDDWYLGLSYVVQKNNIKSWNLRMGQYFWRKCKYLFIGWYVAVNSKSPTKTPNKSITAAFAMKKYFRQVVEPELAKDKIKLSSKLK